MSALLIHVAFAHISQMNGYRQIPMRRKYIWPVQLLKILLFLASFLLFGLLLIGIFFIQ
jgi:hypothetical protein